MRSSHISITALLLRSCQRETPASWAHSSYLGRHSGHRYNNPSSRLYHSGLNPKHSHGASSPMMTCEAQFSAGEDAKAMAYQLTTLLDEHHGQWTLSNGGKGLERDFKFKTFKTTWDFMNLVAEECKKRRHHPEWSNVYNKTHILWTTHDPLGLSYRDVQMARFCDERAAELDEIHG